MPLSWPSSIREEHLNSTENQPGYGKTKNDCWNKHQYILVPEHLLTILNWCINFIFVRIAVVVQHLFKPGGLCSLMHPCQKSTCPQRLQKHAVLHSKRGTVAGQTCKLALGDFKQIIQNIKHQRFYLNACVK